MVSKASDINKEIQWPVRPSSQSAKSKTDQSKDNVPPITSTSTSEAKKKQEPFPKWLALVLSSLLLFAVVIVTYVAFQNEPYRFNYLNVPNVPVNKPQQIVLPDGLSFQIDQMAHIETLDTGSRTPYSVTVPYKAPNNIMYGDLTEQSAPIIQLSNKYWSHPIVNPAPGIYTVHGETIAQFYGIWVLVEYERTKWEIQESQIWDLGVGILLVLIIIGATYLAAFRRSKKQTASQSRK